MSVLQQTAAPCRVVAITPGGRRRRSLLMLPIAMMVVWASSLAAAPAASAAGGQALHPYSGPLTRTGRAAQLVPKGPSATPPGASRAIPLRTPDPARLRRAQARATSRVSGGAGRSPQTLSPLPHAAVFGGLNKPGMSAAESAGAVTPPDTTGAVGPGNYMEFVNGTGITAYDRELNPVSGPVALGNFIGYPLDEVFDPQIQWDPSWGRWVYAMDDIEFGAEIGPEEFEEFNYLAFGWSKTADPANISTEEPGEGLGAGWCSYFIFTGALFDDYPKLGHSDSGLTIGTNVFDPSLPPNEEFQGSRLWSIAKPGSPESCPELGGGSIGVTGALHTEDGGIAFTPVPANTADSSADSYVVASDYPEPVPGHQIMGWHLSGAGTGATLVADGNMNVATYHFPAFVPQPGTAQEIDSLDTRLTNAVAVTDPDAGQEAVWTQHTVDGPGGRSVVRWYELLPATRTVRQEGTISDPSQFVFNGAISPARQGDSAAIDYNRGSETLFPDMHAQSRDLDTSLGQMEGDVLLGTSAGHAVDFSCDIFAVEPEPCRWGDYAGASPDPVQGGVVWGSNQGLAAPSGEFSRWTTRNFALSSDIRAPAAPTITGTDPASPANDNAPKVKGSAESRSTVRVYESANCSGSVAAEGSAASFGSPGLTVSVADNTTTQLSATATDDADNTSSCSNSISYTEVTPPPPPLRGIAAAGKVALVKRGKALLRLRCFGAGPCFGSLRLVARVKARKGKGAKRSKRRARNVVIGRAGFTVQARGRRTLRVRLTRRGRKLVRRARKRGVKVKLRGSGVASRTVLLRQAKKHKHRRGNKRHGSRS
jgi:hypothetical protein